MVGVARRALISVGVHGCCCWQAGSSCYDRFIT
jgi:hypothetical protein